MQAQSEFEHYLAVAWMDIKSFGYYAAEVKVQEWPLVHSIEKRNHFKDIRSLELRMPPVNTLRHTFESTTISNAGGLATFASSHKYYNIAAD